MLSGAGPSAELRVVDQKRKLVLRASLTEELDKWRRAIEVELQLASGSAT